MLEEEIGESEVIANWQKNLQGRVNGNKNGFLPSSFRAISSYLRIVSSGASTVARSAASAAQSIADRDDDANHDQVKKYKNNLYVLSFKFLAMLCKIVEKRRG
ncbi:hypothetical protein OIU77_015372 [Salix suchowensis]|uniref:Uncharacterized protein n=1 Tax=Salix suchowensis TaxID=1278906 RepID=A0ABQ8ZGR1_9ROSI|nr:hypothetical protein OIU77_015372 [Salix suchowensis]KAJ6314103.1 hypothetical protein OIU78_017712 [Salix suchowensis]